MSFISQLVYKGRLFIFGTKKNTPSKRYITKKMTIAEAATVTLTSNPDKDWSVEELFDHLISKGIVIKNPDVLRTTLNKERRKTHVVHRLTSSGRWYGTDHE